ncbi:MAG: transposase [Alphaproteobacteria bacterium]|nr:transposase [Alphaproteobacteria bacterium]
MGEMGNVTRKRYSANFKAKVTLEEIKGVQTVAELAAKHGIHHTRIATWKRQVIEGWRHFRGRRKQRRLSMTPA